jgi:outer membrane protein assembly factor BamE (lipoprotein component of BamABCDE complex)
MRHLAAWSSLALLLLLPACMRSRSTINEPLDATRIAELRAGETTAAEVVELLGAPTEVVQLGRRSAYRYDYLAAKQNGLWLILVFFLNTDTRSDRLWVFFDEENTLTHHGQTLSAADARWAMPWTNVHAPAEAQK